MPATSTDVRSSEAAVRSFFAAYLFASSPNSDRGVLLMGLNDTRQERFNHNNELERSSRAPSSPQDFEVELHDPWRPGARNRAEVRVVNVGGRTTEVFAIEDIEKVGAKPHNDPLFERRK